MFVQHEFLNHNRIFLNEVLRTFNKSKPVYRKKKYLKFFICNRKFQIKRILHSYQLYSNSNSETTLLPGWILWQEGRRGTQISGLPLSHCSPQALKEFTQNWVTLKSKKSAVWGPCNQKGHSLYLQI